MSDLIDRQAAIDAVNKIAPVNTEYDCTLLDILDIRYVLTELPPAEHERKKGKWKRAYLDREAMGERPSIFYCSVCNQCIAYPVNYCPSCGADMRGEKEETE